MIQFHGGLSERNAISDVAFPSIPSSPTTHSNPRPKNRPLPLSLSLYRLTPVAGTKHTPTDQELPNRSPPTTRFVVPTSCFGPKPRNFSLPPIFGAVSDMLGGGGGGGSVYWGAEGSGFRGIVVIFAWVSIQERHLRSYVELYSSLGWNSLVCHAGFLNA